MQLFRVPWASFLLSFNTEKMKFSIQQLSIIQSSWQVDNRLVAISAIWFEIKLTVNVFMDIELSIIWISIGDMMFLR